MRQLHSSLLVLTLVLSPVVRGQTNALPITREAVANAERLIGLDFSDRKSVV